MTEGAGPTSRTPAPRRSRGGIAPVALAALATFLVVLVFLAVQMRLGRDPMLHPRPAAATAPARQVLVRRIEKRTVLVRVIPAEEDDGGSPAPRRDRRRQRTAPERAGRRSRAGPRAGARAHRHPDAHDPGRAHLPLHGQRRPAHRPRGRPDRDGRRPPLAGGLRAPHVALPSRQRAFSAQPRPARGGARVAPAARDAWAPACGRPAAPRDSSIPRSCPRWSALAIATRATASRPRALGEALDRAPARRPAAPSPAAPWRSVAVDDAAGVVRRHPGLCLDTGGVGKGLAADAVAHRLAGLRALRGGLRRGRARRRPGRPRASPSRSWSSTRSRARWPTASGSARAPWRPRGSTFASGAVPTAPTPIISWTRPPAGRPGRGSSAPPRWLPPRWRPRRSPRRRCSPAAAGAQSLLAEHGGVGRPRHGGVEPSDARRSPRRPAREVAA